MMLITKTRSMKNDRLKIICSALAFLLIGILFISLNVVAPNTMSVKKSVTVSQQVSIPHQQLIASEGFTLKETSYVNLPAANLTTGEIFTVTWATDIFIDGYILSQQQFNELQKLPNVSYLTNYEATGYAKQDLTLSYNVTESGSYLAVLVNNSPVSDGFTVDVAYLSESSISYTYQTQNVVQSQIVQENDNLYLYIGIVFLIIEAITILLYKKASKKRLT